MASLKMIRLFREIASLLRFAFRGASFSNRMVQVYVEAYSETAVDQDLLTEIRGLVSLNF